MNSKNCNIYELCQYIMRIPLAKYVSILILFIIIILCDVKGKGVWFDKVKVH